MLQRLKFMNHKLSGAMTLGALMGVSGKAHAANNFSNIAENITTSIQDLPGLLSALAYMFGILLAVLGILKIKDHVENPTQTPLKDGAIRLAAGGALFAIPIISEAMLSTVGDGTAVSAATLKKVDFTTN
ncbi:MAG: hypothetical protein ACT4OY_03835 [Alphaproteobacteria bacterium]